MTAVGQRLVLDLGRAEAVRRRVGPTAWVVLEVLAGQSKPMMSVVEIESSARDLAEVVGLSKDTVARAVRTLARAELVRRVDRRSERTGRFTATTYVVDLAAAGLTVHAVPVDSDTAAAEAGGSTPPAADSLQSVGRLQSQLEHDLRPAAGVSPDERPDVERSADSATDSDQSSAQLSLLSRPTTSIRLAIASTGTHDFRQPDQRATTPTSAHTPKAQNESRTCIGMPGRIPARASRPDTALCATAGRRCGEESPC